MVLGNVIGDMVYMYMSTSNDVRGHPMMLEVINNNQVTENKQTNNVNTNKVLIFKMHYFNL
jgi:hypothetical protein